VLFLLKAIITDAAGDLAPCPIFHFQTDKYLFAAIFKNQGLMKKKFFFA